MDDDVPDNVDETDIDDMGPFESNPLIINTNNNYSYDEEGRLIKDVQEEIDTIIWRVDGKVKEIRRTLTSEKKMLSLITIALDNVLPNMFMITKQEC